MSRVSINLPDALAKFVDHQAATQGFASAELYICDLVRKAREEGCSQVTHPRIQNRRQLEQELLKGVASLDAGRVIEGDDKYLQLLRQRADSMKGTP